MKISARNVLEGTVKEVKKGVTTSHVLIDVKGSIITSSITNEIRRRTWVEGGI